jgi:hypothetical protein
MVPGPSEGTVAAVAGEEEADGGPEASEQAPTVAERAPVAAFSGIAAPGPGRTVPAVPAALTAAKRSERLVGRIRGIPRRHAEGAGRLAVPNRDEILGDVVALRRPLPAMPGVPHVCVLDAKGRFSLDGLAGRFGMAHGDLEADYDGHWVLLCPTGAVTGRRHVARLGTRDRVTVPHHVRARLGAAPGDRVLAMVIEDRPVLALANPAVVLLGAPLGGPR